MVNMNIFPLIYIILFSVTNILIQILQEVKRILKIKNFIKKKKIVVNAV